MFLRRSPPISAARAVPTRLVGAFILASLCAGCAGGGQYAAGWDGRRGYDGNGDYGYDLAAARSEARDYRARAARAYPAPGTPDDPWGPYVHEAAARFQIPERWIRAVMRQESGGHQYGSDGTPITSGAGAMGLMQVMPRTYDTLRQQYALGDDPYDPHDNILAGAAYIRDMYAIYGAPAFLAAYNAGPDRLASYLAGSASLPDETVNYLASVAPRLGTDVAMTGPLAVYAGTATASGAYIPPSGQGYASSGAYIGGGMVVPVSDTADQTASVPDNPADRAFDGGGLVTPDAPTGTLAGQGVTLVAMTARPADRSVAAQALVAPAAMLTPAAAPFAAPIPAPTMLPRAGGWAIQVGAFPDPAHSQAVIAAARARASDLLAATQPAVIPVQRGGMLYRARLVGLSAASAATACARLVGNGMDCFPVPPGS